MECARLVAPKYPENDLSEDLKRLQRSIIHSSPTSSWALLLQDFPPEAIATKLCMYYEISRSSKSFLKLVRVHVLSEKQQILQDYGVTLKGVK